jgi:hypothetical protein
MKACRALNAAHRRRQCCGTGITKGGTHSHMRSQIRSSCHASKQALSHTIPLPERRDSNTSTILTSPALASLQATHSCQQSVAADLLSCTGRHPGAGNVGRPEQTRFASADGLCSNSHNQQLQQPCAVSNVPSPVHQTVRPRFPLKKTSTSTYMYTSTGETCEILHSLAAVHWGVYPLGNTYSPIPQTWPLFSLLFAADTT